MVKLCLYQLLTMHPKLKQFIDFIWKRRTLYFLQGMLVAEIESTAADLLNQLKSEKLHKGVYIAKPANARIGLFKVKI